jgi:peptidoglycan/xylan/chitin deacetylase (PgdA/CDA1 family)
MAAPDRIRRRREETRRKVRRRRIVAILAIVVVAAGAFALIGGAGGGGDNGATGAASAGAGEPGGGAKAKRHTQLVTNATPQPDWVPHTGPVPILEYHVLGAASADAPFPELYTTRVDFRNEMNWLDGHGYGAVTLDQVQRAWYQGATLPPRPVVISFDDGYRPQFTYALPELRRHGWAGLLNLKAGGGDLYPSNVRAMLAAGWELAAHTINHLDLTTLDAASLKHEVAGSRAILRRDYGVPVNNFCYPAGSFNATVIAAVRTAGYAGATTEIPGYAGREKPYELARFEILGSTGVPGLASMLSSGP